MLVNAVEILKAADIGKYAVGHFNINNLEWTKNILEVCEEEETPVILGVSEGAIKYMGGYNVVSQMVQALVKDLKITVPVVLHLDHGSSFESCKNAIDAGFTSVMIDGSSLSLNENIEITKQVVSYAHERNVSVEGEIGSIGGNEDGIVNKKLYASLDDCIKYVNESDVDILAPALGSVHGLYKGDPNLDFKTMEEIHKAISVPLVLHGASGLSDMDITHAISCGISKINVNTEFQIAWHRGVMNFIIDNHDVYDPRKVIGSGRDNMKKIIREKIHLFRNGKF